MKTKFNIGCILHQNLMDNFVCDFFRFNCKKKKQKLIVKRDSSIKTNISRNEVKPVKIYSPFEIALKLQYYMDYKYLGGERFWKSMEFMNIKIYTVYINSSSVLLTEEDLKIWISIYLPKFYNNILNNIELYFESHYIFKNNMIPTTEMTKLLRYASDSNDLLKDVFKIVEYSQKFHDNHNSSESDYNVSARSRMSHQTEKELVRKSRRLTHNNFDHSPEEKDVVVQ